MRLLGHPSVTFVLIRVGFLLGTAFMLIWVLPSHTTVLAFDTWHPVTDYVFGAFAQWDSDWYVGIAADGYNEKSAAFFPLFPGLVYVLGEAIGSFVVAGVLISLAGAAVGAWALVEIAKPLIGEAAGKDTVLILALYPTAFVFTAPYSEGLFLGFATTSILAAQRGRPWIAGVLAGLAVATRLMGIALVPALIALLWPKTRAQIPQLAPVILLPLMGLASVALVFDLALGDALAFSHAQVYWDRDTSWLGPINGLYQAFTAVPDSFTGLTSLPGREGIPGEAPGIFEQLKLQNAQLALWNVVDLLALAGAVALTVVAYRRLGLPFALYSAAFLTIAASAPGSSIPLNSMVRFIMVDFPVLMAGAALVSPRPQLRTGVLVTLGALTAVAGITFARKNWVA